MSMHVLDKHHLRMSYSVLGHECNVNESTVYSKSPTFEPSSCVVSKMQTCVHMSIHLS